MRATTAFSAGHAVVGRPDRLELHTRGDRRRAPYFKMGIYKGWRDRQQPKGMVSRRVIYHDEVRFAGPAGTYDDVAPQSAE